MADANANLGTTIASLVPSEKLLANRVDFLTRTTNLLVTSGLAVSAGEEGARLMTGGPRKGSLTYVKPLDTDVVNVSTDDDTPGKTGRITAAEYGAVRHDLNMGWKYFDLSEMITQYDIQGGIEAGLAEYWDAQGTKLGVNSIKGALASAGASALTIGNATTDFSRDLLIDAAATAEEFSENFDLMFTSPARAAQLKKDRTNYAPGDTGISLPTYGGMRVIVTTAFGADTTVIAKRGALAYFIGTVPYEKPIEIDRSGQMGNGGGREILWSRRSFVVHPQGFDYVGATGLAPEAMATGANWKLADGLDKKFVGFRAIKHKV